MWSDTVPGLSVNTMLEENHKQILLSVARNSIRHGLEKQVAPKITEEDYSEHLREILATFVTLKIDNRLRGCIGTTHAVYPLVVSVNQNAWSSAFRDPRFKPLEKNEFDQIHVDISILTPSKQILFTSEEELLDKLEAGTDGLIIEKNHQRATFLPSVWESLPDRKDFLQQLKLKARIPPNQCPDRAWVYHSIIIEE